MIKILFKNNIKNLSNMTYKILININHQNVKYNDVNKKLICIYQEYLNIKKMKYLHKLTGYK